jgi:hypothetical protein
MPAAYRQGDVPDGGASPPAGVSETGSGTSPAMADWSGDRPLPRHLQERFVAAAFEATRLLAPVDRLDRCADALGERGYP